MKLIEKIQKIKLIPVMETELSELQGFMVRAYRKNSSKKACFISNAIQTICFVRPGSTKIQTTISWLLDKRVMEVEEHVLSPERRAAFINRFQIDHDDIKRPEIVKGEPRIVNNTFKGKTVEMRWMKRPGDSEPTITANTADSSSFTCKINQKRRKIDILLDSRGNLEMLV
ncbi:MAG: hypothetical protein ACFFD4_24260 [Candidatus Odinarchaeota archaeon]